MYFDYLTLVGLLSAISVSGILYAMASKDISGGCVSMKRTAQD
jgi:hypothetical protein